MTFTLEQLKQIIDERALASPEQSYSAKLLAKGTKKCAEKFGEEAIEAIIAASTGDSNELKNEAADVLYHLLILLKSSGVELSEVLKELENRTKQSGLAEKSSRKIGQ